MGFVFGCQFFWNGSGGEGVHLMWDGGPFFFMSLSLPGLINACFINGFLFISK